MENKNDETERNGSNRMMCVSKSQQHEKISFKKSNEKNNPKSFFKMGNGESVPNEIESPDASNQVHMAAYGNHIEKLKQMKASKVNLFVKDEKNRTALHYAAGRGAAQTLEFLLEQQGGRDWIDVKDLEELTSLDYACIAVCRNAQIKSIAFECAKLLLSAGCDLSSLQFMPLDTVATDGRTLVHWAAKSGQVKLLKCLLEKDPAFVKTKDRRGWTPLMCASLCTADTVRETLSFLLNFLREKSSKVEAMQDIFAALAIGLETWNHIAVDVLLTYLGETASNEGEQEVCRLFNAPAATAASMAAMVRSHLSLLFSTMYSKKLTNQSHRSRLLQLSSQPKSRPMLALHLRK